MKRRMHSVLVITTVALAALIATPSWAAQSTKSKKTFVDSRTAPKPQIKPVPAGSVGTMQPMIIKADLQVGVVKVTPQNPREGQQVTFEGNVMNYGAGAAQQPEVRLPHHDKYSAAPKVKCSTGVNFYDWQQCDSQYPSSQHSFLSL